MALITRTWMPVFSIASCNAIALITVDSMPMWSAATRSMWMACSATPRKKLPPPTTIPIWQPDRAASAISWATALTNTASTPKPRPAARASPESFNRTRLYMLSTSVQGENRTPSRNQIEPTKRATISAIRPLLPFQHPNHRIGQLLVGMRKQQRHVPHLIVCQDALERGHAAEADAVLHLPVGLSRRVIANAYNILMSMLLPKLRRVRIHLLGERNILPRDAMAARALQLVGLRSSLVHILTDAKRWLLHLAIDARMLRHLNDLRLKGERLIGSCDRQIAKLEVAPRTSEQHGERKDKAKKKLQDATRPTRTRSRLTAWHIATPSCCFSVVYFLPDFPSRVVVQFEILVGGVPPKGLFRVNGEIK